jgi:hypothetical protein
MRFPGTFHISLYSFVFGCGLLGFNLTKAKTFYLTFCSTKFGLSTLVSFSKFCLLN